MTTVVIASLVLVIAGLIVLSIGQWYLWTQERRQSIELQQRIELWAAEAQRLESVAETALQDAMEKAAEFFKREEARLRADAIARSQVVIKGKVAEQLVPFTEEFGYNPRDSRFLGSPIDLIVFDGLSEGDLDKVVFIEVKTGLSRLSKRERQVRDVVDAGEVYYEEVRL